MEAPGARRLMDELRSLEKQIVSLTALIPIVGPWLVSRSEAHPRPEQARLLRFSIGVTVLFGLGVVALVPGAADRQIDLRRRVDQEIQTLADLATGYRKELGTFPRSETWQRLARRADPRFFDPWGRPYRYQVSESGLTISTLGRDGVEGGKDEDADIGKHFPRS